jgi:hypothetical protein
MVPLPAGGLCAYAFNLLQGQSTLVGCPGLSSNPFGSLDVIGPAPGGIRAAGWIIDPNTTASTEVHVYVNGIGYRFSANGGRGDVSAVYPPWGASHGFDVTVPGVEGQNDVCVYAFNLGAGTTSPLLGCRSYTLSHRPYGSFDVVYQSNGTRRAAGWAIDPDTAQPIAVHLYVGSVVTPAVANALRADVGALAPFYGARHGFDSPVPVGNVVCAYAINVDSGENVGLGCRDG